MLLQKSWTLRFRSRFIIAWKLSNEFTHYQTIPGFETFLEKKENCRFIPASSNIPSGTRFIPLSPLSTVLIIVTWESSKWFGKCFLKTCTAVLLKAAFPGVSKGVIVWEWVKLVNSLPNDKILVWSKSRAFADDKYKCD